MKAAELKAIISRELKKENPNYKFIEQVQKEANYRKIQECKKGLTKSP